MSIMFSVMVVPIYLLTDSVQGFVHVLANTWYLLSFDNSHSDKYEGIAHCHFHFPNDK